MSALAEALVAARREPCRLCGTSLVEPHYLIGTEAVPENIVPLCATDRELVTRGHRTALYRLGEALTDAERAYVLDKGTDVWLERAFGGAVAR